MRKQSGKSRMWDSSIKQPVCAFKRSKYGWEKKQWGCSNLKRLKNIKENKTPGINLTKEVKDLYTTDERN